MKGQSKASITRKRGPTRARPKTSRKPPSRRKPKGVQRRAWWFGLALVVVCLAAGFLLGRLISPPPTRPPVPSLSERIHLVDLALKSQFYMLGLSERDVVARKSRFHQRDGEKWRQVTTTIQLPRPIPFQRIVSRLDREISTLGRDFSVTGREGKGLLQVEVRVRDAVVHNLFFRAPKLAKPEIPPKGRVAIVIDDLGERRKIAMDFLNLNVPLSFSVFPFARHSREFAREATRRGRDVLLHLPLEPKGYPEQDPGKGGLLTTMGRKELVSQLEKDLSAVPYVKGVNNHMGSKFTEDPELMRLVLEDVRRKGLFFLDSRTTAKSVGYSVARQLGLRTGRRNVFLDNEKDVERIKARISELIELSMKNGGAIGIGHPYPETLEAIRQSLPSIKENGVRLVPVSSLLE